MQTRIDITQKTIRTAYRIALRTGKFFRLHPDERAILTISANVIAILTLTLTCSGRFSRKSINSKRSTLNLS